MGRLNFNEADIESLGTEELFRGWTHIDLVETFQHIVYDEGVQERSMHYRTKALRDEIIRRMGGDVA